MLLLFFRGPAAPPVTQDPAVVVGRARRAVAIAGSARPSAIIAPAARRAVAIGAAARPSAIIAPAARRAVAIVAVVERKPA
jgi:hypothetical protein